MNFYCVSHVSYGTLSFMSTKTDKISGIYPILDTSVIAISHLQKIAAEIVEGGVRLLQLRAEGLPTKELVSISLGLRDITQKTGVSFIINNRVDAAIISGADGVHIGQKDLPCREVRKLLGKEKIIGISTHNRLEVREAEKDGADYIAYGPIFPTSTKKDTDRPKGIEGLKNIKEYAHVPVVAIGGINEKNILDVMGTGIDSVAIISDILTAPDITGKIERLKAAINGVRISHGK
jgi:thiamine-phosphate pyrophosphorylase